jgi:hypothetical protein
MALFEGGGERDASSSATLGLARRSHPSLFQGHTYQSRRVWLLKRIL